jgi:hypothetical protein
LAFGERAGFVVQLLEDLHRRFVHTRGTARSRQDSSGSASHSSHRFRHEPPMLTMIAHGDTKHGRDHVGQE